ncbi:MAG: hypothetical protein AAFR87_31050 [Bacteroidota bacterium]
MSSPKIPQNLTFENAFTGSFSITNGTFSLLEGNEDTTGFPGDPTVDEIIQTDQSATVKVKWDTTGTLVPFLQGNWKGEVFLEKMGGGEVSGAAPSTTIAYNPAVNSYSLTIVIPPNTVDAGIYRVVVCLSLEGITGQPGPVAAFGDLGLIKFYKG